MFGWFRKNKAEPPKDAASNDDFAKKCQEAVAAQGTKDLKEIRAEIVRMGNELHEIVGIPFEQTTELQRQLLAAFVFGMTFAIGHIKKLSPPDVHALAICFLQDVFKYSVDQSAAFAENLIQSASGRGNPTTKSVIHRGIDGHWQWEQKKFAELKANVDDVFKVVGA
jgi:hypothetical protein